jgi:hypothetical protein
MTLTAVMTSPQPNLRELSADHAGRQQQPPGRLDRCDIAGILAALPQLPTWPADNADRNRWRRGARQILDWLQTYPGDGWHDRWLAVDMQDRSWRERVEAATFPTPREQLLEGMRGLLLLRVLRPSYEFLLNYRAVALYDCVRVTICPESFARSPRKRHALVLPATSRTSRWSHWPKWCCAPAKTLDNSNLRTSSSLMQRVALTA